MASGGFPDRLCCDTENLLFLHHHHLLASFNFPSSPSWKGAGVPARCIAYNNIGQTLQKSQLPSLGEQSDISHLATQSNGYRAYLLAQLQVGETKSDARPSKKLSSAEGGGKIQCNNGILGLHSAAATGNLGLVEFALDRGQPVNSVLDGVLPLHAASAGGNVQVVKLLLDHGADVNAPRLPRRFSNDRNRDSSAPIVGTSGSTPLHFAAANGNYEVINLLLLRGAHADRADKHGVTPEKLARQHRWVECADLLREWMVNKDRDLRERPGGVDDRVRQSSRSDPSGNDEACTSSLSRRRLHVKQSFDNALSRLKPIDRSQPLNAASPPASPSRPFADTSDHPPDMDRPEQVASGQRRPSLPHIMQPSIVPPRSRKTSTPNITGTNTPQRPGSSSGLTENTDQESNQGSARGIPPRKIGSKLSLLNLFKKGQVSEGGQLSDISLPLPATTGPTSSSSLNDNFTTVGDVASADTTQSQPSNRKASVSSVRSPPAMSAVDLHNAMIQERQVQPQKIPSRDRAIPRDGESNGQDGAASSAPSSSPLARIFRSKNHNRDRSGSGASLGYKEEKSFESTSTGLEESLDASQAQSPKPSILKSHGRTSSGGPSTSSPGLRALRFDSSSTTGSNRSNSGYSNGANRGLRICNSAGSLTRYQSVGPLIDPMDSDEEDFGQEKGRSAPPATQSYGDYPPLLEGEESDPHIQAKSPQSMLLARDRGLSITSASDVSLSPILANEERIDSRLDMFPFDINKPPNDPEHLQVPKPVELRARGDSISSASTTDSQHNPALSHSSTTSGSAGSDTINTPWMSPEKHSLPPPDVKVTSGSNVSESPLAPMTPETKVSTKASPRRTHIPPEINLASISSHAQAEALVQKTQQDIFDMATSNEVTPTPSSIGLSPLSAKLAAYGESLALERRFREQKEVEALRTSNSSRSPHSQTSALPEIIMTEDGGILNSGPVSRNGVGRQHSLEYRPGRPRMNPRPKTPKRPSTAEGVTPRREDQLFFSREGSGRSGHQASRSASGFSTSPPSKLALVHDINDTLWGERPAISPPSVDSPPISRSLNTPSTAPARSRTPIGDPAEGRLSRINSLDNPDPSNDFSPLTRVTSTPLVPSRTAKSSVKLAKMGFPASSSQAPVTPSKKPFSLRGIVQTLKGKT